MSQPIYVTLNCPHCGADIEVEVYVNEEADIPDECPECGEELDQLDLYDKAQEDAVSKLIDSADRLKD